MYTSGFYNCDGFLSVINHACSISGHGISEAPRVRLHAADPLLSLLQVIIEAVFEETQSHETLSTVSGFSISSTFRIIFPTFTICCCKLYDVKSLDILVVTEDTTT